MDVPVYNMQGQEVGAMPIDEVALGETVNPVLIKQAYVMYHANTRQGSARTKNRGAVAFSGKKIYKQKGTGRARHGDKKVGLMRKGGHGHSKKKTREDFRLTMPKKMRRKANRNALLAKLVDSEVKVIDGLTLDAPRTRAMVDFLKSLGIEKSALLALSPDSEKSKNARLSARNIDGVSMCRADQLTAFEMLNSRHLVIDRADLEEWLAGPSSQTGKDAKLEPKGAGEKKPRRVRPYTRKQAVASAEGGA
ncbi:MAG: 50S ribosomal protein L4 [Phycisphaerales bacterium JB040]